VGFTVIVTLGPSLNNPDKLKQISSLGNCIFRINGAHVLPDQVQGVVQYVRQVLPNAVMMVDLPGNKVRTANLSEPIRLVKGEKFDLLDNQLNFNEFYKYVKVGDVVFANDSIFRLEVVKIDGKRIQFLSHSDGLLQTNKGFHVKGVNEKLPFLFKRDLDLISSACESGVNIVSLSFVRTAADVNEAYEVLRSKKINNVQIFAKIETAMALENLDEILEVAETVNVDRGDLSSDIGMINLAEAQAKIVQAALNRKRPVFLATQFLKNMETNPVPLIAEMIDLHNTVKSGISGIQLSEETAVGKHSVDCVKTIFDVVKCVGNR
jgi:pyruvate kinase